MTTRIGVTLLLAAMLAACDPVGKAWDQAQSANTIDAYKSFLAANPGSGYESEAMQHIDGLAWDAASAANTEESYAQYQADYPAGTHADEAAERIHKVRIDDFNANFDAQLLAFVRLEDSAIATIQGKSWDDLKPRVGVVSGGFDVVGGAAILRKGSVAVYEDRDKQFRIFGVMDQPQYALDAKPASLQGSEFEPGVRIGLVSGETLEYGDAGWRYVDDTAAK
jgi:hypothetical protein